MITSHPALSRFLALLLITTAFSCRPKADEREKQAFLATADSISVLAQQLLLKNVSEAVQAGGPVMAIDFCSLNAGNLTDSLSIANSVIIRRLTDQPRNLENLVRDHPDKAIWSYFQKTVRAGGSPRDTVISSGAPGHLVYYKPILLAMPTCLKCHGDPSVDIGKSTLVKISEKYPEDKAVGYRPGDLRGMWKISATRKTEI